MKTNRKECEIVTVCPICGEEHLIPANLEDFHTWDEDDNALVQDVFPYLSADEREMLISGICPDCWDKLFGE